MIKEIIVVEGKADVSAVKRAVDAQVISTNGLGINKEIIDIIKKASEKKGIIILTDPDYPGKKIRNILASEVDKCKHAFIARDKANKGGDIGVENASPEAIIEALKNAKAEVTDKRQDFNQGHMFYYGLVGCQDAAKRRARIGDELGIGYCSGKQFLKRLNSFGISRQELEEAIDKILEDE